MNHNVIEVNNARALVNRWAQGSVHQVNKRGRSIAEAESHHLPFIMTLGSAECGLVAIFRGNQHLVVNKMDVKMGENGRTREIVR